MNERERLAKLMYEDPDDFPCGRWEDASPQMRDVMLGYVDRLRAEATVTLPPAPTPRPVWPGLEGEGMAETQRIGIDAFDAVLENTGSDVDAQRAYQTAVTAHLFRALVAGLPGAAFGEHRVWLDGRWIDRSALAELADPYDGGGK